MFHFHYKNLYRFKRRKYFVFCNIEPSPQLPPPKKKIINYLWHFILDTNRINPLRRPQLSMALLMLLIIIKLRV